MKSTDELIISKNYWKLLLFALGALIFVYLGYRLVSDADSFISSKYRGTGFIIVAGIISIIFFGMIAILVITILINRKPAFIINSKGIIDHGSAIGGFLIRWEDIGRLQIKTIQKTKFIIVHVKNPQFYLTQAGIFKRFWMNLNYKIYGTPIAITTNTMNISTEELIKMIRESKKEFNKKTNHADRK